MKNVLKHLFTVFSYLFALIGLLTCSAALYAGWHLANSDFRLFGTESSTGKAAANKGRAHLLPLPAQTEPNLPMMVEKDNLPDDEWLLIFRAPAAWQEAFCTLYNFGGSDFIGDDRARKLADEVEDKSILQFINSKQWQHFHSGRLRPDSDCHFSAMRDASGEYVLLYLYTL